MEALPAVTKGSLLYNPLHRDNSEEITEAQYTSLLMDANFLWSSTPSSFPAGVIDKTTTPVTPVATPGITPIT